MIKDDGFKCCDDCFNCDLFLSFHDCAYERSPLDCYVPSVKNIHFEEDYELQNTCN